MPVAYQVRVFDTSGALQAVVERFRSIIIEHRVNSFSTLTLSLFTQDEAVQYFTLDALIEIRRRVPEAGLDWYTEYIGFHRTPQRQITEADSRIFTSYSRGLLDLLNRRSVRYYSDTDGSAKGPAPADDVIKDYVRENAGSLATLANNRVTDGVFPGLTVASNLGAAPDYEGANAWKNLLDTCADIGEPHNVDFDIVWTGGATFQFRTYYPFQGTDRREGGVAPFIFAPEFGNMANPSHTQSRTDEVTSALVLGPGEGPLRDTTLLTAPTITDSPWNLIEQDINAPGEDRTEAINDIGNDVLYEKRAVNQFSFNPIQTFNSSYGKHYFLGDMVTARFDDITIDVKITAVTVSISDDSENVTLELVEQTDAFEG